MQSLSDIIKNHRQASGLTQEEVADRMGMSRRGYQYWEQGRSIPSALQLKELANILRISQKEIARFGDVDTAGKRNKPLAISAEEKENSAVVVRKDWPGLPVYNVPITASFVEVYRDEHIAPEYYLKDRKYIDCDFAAVIRGDSMHSEIRHGDYVICKRIEDLGFLAFGEIYYIVSTNGLETCKYLHPDLNNEDRLLLVAYNKSVPSSPIPKKYIRSLYKVRGIIRAY